MEPIRFYGKARCRAQTCEIPDGSDDSELSAEEYDVDVDDTCRPDSGSDDSERRRHLFHSCLKLC